MDDVLAERARQDSLWGVQDLDPSVWSMILHEEAGEATTEACDWWRSCRDGADILTAHHLVRLREELVQVAAVALAWIECLDRDDWRKPNVGSLDVGFFR